MDQDTRNKLQRATQQVRRILEEEFAEQMEGTFDVLANGEILPESGKHLDARQRLTRRKLVDAIEHIKAGGKTSQEAVHEYRREAAFTFLNRFVALRMLEARGVIQECVSQGDASSGFREFGGLAPGLSSLSDGGYRLYLESLFDELSVEVKVLFDRSDSASLLWPERGSLMELLAILGQTDLESVWNEDETIGWVYQYFNSGEERKKMREESSAPRNSRELAVRNQFFTPRYVVEFLTDNTLGRIWYEMRQGQTKLVDVCRYLVRQTTEVFLEKGQDTPGDNPSDEQDISREELLTKPVYIPHRTKKDPRDLKILDPACGSGHFLMYAFDLLVLIYEESWRDESSPRSEISGQRLQEDYPDLGQLHAALPGLVLAHNLHGIDIDPRAAQIAALALWMRGQRAFNEFQIERTQRPIIHRSNIVCAEPMPGEKAFLDEFIAEHLSTDAEGRFLASLVRKVFEVMKLAGEAGSLLKVEDDIAEEVATAKAKWLEQPKFRQQTLFTDAPQVVQQTLDLTRGITDESFWDDAETKIYDALSRYSESAEAGGYRRKLFSADAARGFAFIDLCRTRYDVALMNPPFGEPTSDVDTFLRKRYLQTKNDIYAAFIEMLLSRRAFAGAIGAITSKTFFYTKSQRDLRALLSSPETPISLAVDIGPGVLDDAAVETAAYVIWADRPRLHSMFIDLTDSPSSERSSELRTATGDPISSRRYLRALNEFSPFPFGAYAYWAPDRVFTLFRSNASFEPSYGDVVKGITTFDDFRFCRLTWEVSQESDRWVGIAKGGGYGLFYREHEVVVDWLKNGSYLQSHEFAKYDTNARTTQSKIFWFQAGLTFSEVSSIGFSVQAWPSGRLFGGPGFVIVPHNAADSPAWAAVFNSNYASSILTLLSTDRHWSCLSVGRLPVPEFSDECFDQLRCLGGECIELMSRFGQISETAREFISPFVNGQDVCKDFKSAAGVEEQFWSKTLQDLSLRLTQINSLVNTSARIDGDQIGVKVKAFEHANSLTLDGAITADSEAVAGPAALPARVVSYLIGAVFGRFQSISYNSIEIGVLDQGHSQDLEKLVVQASEQIGISDDLLRGTIEQMCGDTGGLRKWIASSFFDWHIKRYSRSRRKAPVYWQLATPSAAYSIWLYYHRLTKDTFFQVLNEFVKPKLSHEQRKLDRLRGEAGAEPTRTQRKVLEDQEKLIVELSSFREEIQRIAPLWNPNINDGVIINFAVLWRLVPQNKSWQKECKKVWDKLVKGEYDWAHLAMHLWPERVVPQCVTDASLAIAHGLEDVFWEQDDRDRFRPKEEPAGGWEPVVGKLIDERTSPAVKVALENLLKAPAPAGNTKSRPRKARK